MEERNVVAVLEEACEAVVFAQPSDLQALVALHTLLQEVEAGTRDGAEVILPQAARATAKLIERIVLQECDEPMAALQAVGDSLGILQGVVRDGRPSSEVVFPGLIVLEPLVEDSPAPAPVTTSTPVPQAKAVESVPLQGDPALLREFVEEATDHLQAADIHLLTLETNPKEEEAVNAVFRAFHTIKGVAGFLALEQIQKVAHEAESLLDRARKGEVSLCGRVIDPVFDAVDALKRLVGRVQEALITGAPLAHEAGLEVLVERLRSGGAGDAVPAEVMPDIKQDTRVGEILVEMGAVSSEIVEQTLSKQKSEQETTEGGAGLPGEVHHETPKVGELLVKDGLVAAKDVAQALRAQKTAQQQAAQMREPVKVDADRLDRLVDLIGELVIAESMVSQSQEMRVGTTAQLLRHLGQLDKITRELQAMGMSLRMVPIRATFQKMARLARDVAKKANKTIEFITAGEDTELDKTVVDKIGDPLVHMVRNAVDHGIESAVDQRLRAGKPEAGRVTLRAYHKGGNIIIEIEDDGRGLDRDAILAKGIERGLVREGETLADRDIWNLIFQPGFSTAKEVTDVSGRGVGMDVVRRNVEALRGQIDLHSERGHGTVVTIRLPLTLAIIDGMVVGVGTERYVIPTLSIVRSIRPRREDISTVAGRGEMLALPEGLIPLFRLAELFEVCGGRNDPCDGLVVIAEEEGRCVGLVVDQLLGQQQIVIKNLGDAVARTPGIAGGAIMPDGQVGLILDVAGIVRLANTYVSMPEHRTEQRGSEPCKVTQ